MAFMRRQAEPVPETETDIWTCTNEDCTGWMRKGFSFEENPACPLCESSMTSDVKMLPELKN